MLIFKVFWSLHFLLEVKSCFFQNSKKTCFLLVWRSLLASFLIFLIIFFLIKTEKCKNGRGTMWRYVALSEPENY